MASKREQLGYGIGEVLVRYFANYIYVDMHAWSSRQRGLVVITFYEYCERDQK